MKTSKTTRRIGCWLAALSAVLLAAAAPAQTGGESAGDSEPRAAQAQLTLDDLRTFTDVFNQVRRNYVESVDDRTLLEAAIRGMLSDLDPHSAYISGDAYRDIRDSSEGRYEGIGVNLEPRDGKVVVVAVINDSPADQAGINPGDTIVAIDGEPLEGSDLEEAIDSLLGQAGTTVELIVLPPEGEERTVTLQRANLQIPAMSFRLLDRSWGYFSLSVFNKDSGRSMEAALDSLQADGIDLRGIVIDLRDNPGGVLQGAVEMADGFLDEGLIVTTRGRNASMQMEFRAHAGQWLADVPLIILVDRGTASASEVLAGALQDHRRALIVGERTFGKGSVQSVLPLRNGAGIKLTTARYYTPSGRSIQAEGISPDVVYEAGGNSSHEDRRIRESDLEGHLVRDASEPGTAAVSSDGPAAGDYLEEALQILEQANILVDSIPEDGQPPGAGPL